MSQQDLPSLSSLQDYALLSVFLDGLHTAVFLATVYGIVIYGRAQMSASRVLVYFAILVMYALSTVHTAATWLVVESVFIANDRSVLGSLRFGNGPGPAGKLLVEVSEFALPVNIFLADCILIWRCWAVWNRKTKIVFLPAICAVVGAVLGFLIIGIQMYSIMKFEKTLVIALGTAYFILTFVSQLSATLLIIYRILNVTHGQIRGYSHVVEMVVESAAPNCLILIIVLPFLEGSAVDPGSSYLQAILLYSTGIGPTLIAARVAFGMARSDDEWNSSSPILGETAQWSRTTLTRVSTQLMSHSPYSTK